MKRLIFIFMVVVCAISSLSYGAVNAKKTGVKKAAPVATKQEDKLESATSLIPVVTGFMSSVTELKKQQQELTSDCAPTGSEIEMVNNLMREWAKTSASTADKAVSTLGYPCSSDKNNNSSRHYQTFMETADRKESCYESFTDQSDRDTVWYAFPKASSAKLCDAVNTKDCRIVSNVYEVFNVITFDPEKDYTDEEYKSIQNFLQKKERCSDSKVASATRELYTNFVTQTLGNVGQSTGATGTAAVLEAVSALGGSGNFKSVLPSIGQMVPQILEK